MKGNESEAPSAVFGPWSSHVFLPFLPLILVSCIILSAWPNQAPPPSGLAWLLSESRCDMAYGNLSLQRLPNVSPAIIKLSLPFGLGGGLASLIVPSLCD